MKTPVTFDQLQSLEVISDFNRVHGTDLTWHGYFREIGMNGLDARDNRELEYELYVRWVNVRNSPPHAST